MTITLYFCVVSDEGVYNTYVLDTDYTSWLLLLHCAEKTGSPRYLSSLLMRRSEEEPLTENVIAYLRDKLQRYKVSLEYMFPMPQQACPQQHQEGTILRPVYNHPAFRRG
jgi:apolipoprotein D and lipocalin family protein